MKLCELADWINCIAGLVHNIHHASSSRELHAEITDEIYKELQEYFDEIKERALYFYKEPLYDMNYSAKRIGLAEASYDVEYVGFNPGIRDVRVLLEGLLGKYTECHDTPAYLLPGTKSFLEQHMDWLEQKIGFLTKWVEA